MSRRFWLIPLSVLLGAALIFLIPNISFLRRPNVEDGRLLGRSPFLQADSASYFPYKLAALPQLTQTGKERFWKRKYRSPEDAFERNGTLALLVIKNDTIVYENYFNGFHCDTITQIFSATKPMVVSLLTIALAEGYIDSLDQPVSDFLPEFRIGDYDKITLRHLAQMRSGFDYDEYKKIMGTLKFYYQRNLSSFMKDPRNIKLRFAPGEKFTYKSIDTQILGACIEQAVGKTMKEYFYDKIWKHIGAEDPAFWSVADRTTGMLRFYGGLNMSVKDLAKLGVMYANNGQYRGKQLLPIEWVNYCDDVENRNGQNTYCMGWWYDQNDQGNNIYFGAGFGGQIMFVNETTKTVIVRLGYKKGGLPWYRLFKELSIVL
jgi:CubicO group peptidase (beta-lactamase class C family)